MCNWHWPHSVQLGQYDCSVTVTKLVIENALQLPPKM